MITRSLENTLYIMAPIAVCCKSAEGDVAFSNKVNNITFHFTQNEIRINLINYLIKMYVLAVNNSSVHYKETSVCSHNL